MICCYGLLPCDRAHYGSYETTFLKRMKGRYGEAMAYPGFVDQLVADSVNILSAIYAKIYFPTYSNSLKEIAKYLGFQWSESDASGIYNAEDCAALQRITECIDALAVKAEVPNSANLLEYENIDIALGQELRPETSRGEWGLLSSSILILPILTSVLILIISEKKYSFALPLI